MEKMIIMEEYLDSTDFFSKNSIKVLLQQAGANKYSIKLKQSKQPYYKSIDNFRLIKLEIFKIYIKIKLANNFINLFKLPANTTMLLI